MTSDAIELSDAVDVVLGNPILKESVRPLVEWFREISVIFRGERGLTQSVDFGDYASADEGGGGKALL